MKRQKLEYDIKNMKYRKVGFDFLKYLLLALRVIVVSLSLSIVLYGLFATFISTDTERRLKREIKAYEEVYPRIAPRMEMIGESVSVLEVKDNAIYGNVFHNEAPSVDPMSSLEMFYGADTIPDTKIVTYTTAKTEKLVKQAEVVEEAFARIFGLLASGSVQMPPMILPVEDISYTQTGASVGQKRNPFLNTEVRHNGIDFIVPQGTPVLATADGTVVSVRTGSKGDGNSITLSHDGGYETFYCHLSEIRVKEGQSVRKGRVIGVSGMSGEAFAPHLHYAVMLDGQVMEPVNYIFASVSPREYSNMLYMSVNTRQSMD